MWSIPSIITRFVLFYRRWKIDFRELVKDLAAVFKTTRIELRQVGVRDETKIVGGIGIWTVAVLPFLFIRVYPGVH